MFTNATTDLLDLNSAEVAVVERTDLQNQSGISAKPLRHQHPTEFCPYFLDVDAADGLRNCCLQDLGHRRLLTEIDLELQNFNRYCPIYHQLF